MAQLTARQYDRLYYDEHTAAGLDYAAYGDWQRNYGRWLVEVLNLQGKRVIDVGCACGAQLRGLIEACAQGTGVDVSEYMVEIGSPPRPWGMLAARRAKCFRMEGQPAKVRHANGSAELSSRGQSIAGTAGVRIVW